MNSSADATKTKRSVYGRTVDTVNTLIYVFIFWVAIYSPDNPFCWKCWRNELLGPPCEHRI